MTIKRTAFAHWTGSGKEGKGHLTTQSGVMTDQTYGFQSRFEDGPGTNPEELIGAAHAGCFSMKLAFVLQGKGLTAESIETKSTVILQDGAIADVQLETKVRVDGLADADFQELAREAKDNCPISKLLNAKIAFSAVLG